MRRSLVIGGVVIALMVMTQTAYYFGRSSEPVQTGSKPTFPRINATEHQVSLATAKTYQELAELKERVKQLSELAAAQCDVDISALPLPPPAPTNTIVTPSKTLERLLHPKRDDFDELSFLDTFDGWVLFPPDKFPTVPLRTLQPLHVDDGTPFDCVTSSQGALRVNVVSRPLRGHYLEYPKRMAGMVLGRRGIFPAARHLIEGFQGSNPGTTLIVLNETLNQDEWEELTLFEYVHVVNNIDFVKASFTSGAAPGKTCGDVAAKLQLKPLPTDMKQASCSAQMVAPLVLPSFNHVTPPRPVIAMCILVYHTSDIGNVGELAIVRRMFPHFLNTIAGSMARFDFVVYLALQPQPFFDENDMANARLLHSTLVGMAAAAKIDMKIVLKRYPLNVGLSDITFKWNVLISDAYDDGADYFYQFSDDTEFKSDRWADYIVDCLNEQGGVGIGGAKDLNNPDLLTLSMSGRKHVELFGTYWPAELKNWYSDDWAHNQYGYDYRKFHIPSYGERFRCARDDVVMWNTQQNGQRYSSCAHNELLLLLLHRGYYRIYTYLVQNQAELKGAPRAPTPQDLMDITDKYEEHYKFPCLPRHIILDENPLLS